MRSIKLYIKSCLSYFTRILCKYTERNYFKRFIIGNRGQELFQKSRILIIIIFSSNRLLPFTVLSFFFLIFFKWIPILWYKWKQLIFIIFIAFYVFPTFRLLFSNIFFSWFFVFLVYFFFFFLHLLNVFFIVFIRNPFWRILFIF